MSARGQYRVWREREQCSADGRDWADYQGPSRLDETIPVARVATLADAISELERVMRDRTMGGHRYGRITHGVRVVARVTRRGTIELADRLGRWTRVVEVASP